MKILLTSANPNQEMDVQKVAVETCEPGEWVKRLKNQKKLF